MTTPFSIPQDIRSHGKVVLAFGTYDKLHPGHEYFLRKAKEQGDYLVVVIARDDNVETLKGKRPTHDEQTRRQAVMALDVVDFAMLGRRDFSKRYDVINDIQPNIICLGYDQAPHFTSPDPAITIVRIDAFQPEKYKSSLL